MVSVKTKFLLSKWELERKYQKNDEIVSHPSNQRKKKHSNIKENIFTTECQTSKYTLAWHSKKAMNLNKRVLCEMDKNVRNVKRPPQREKKKHTHTQQEQTNAH